MTSDTDTGLDMHKSDNLGHEFGLGHAFRYDVRVSKIFNFGRGFGHGHEIFLNFGLGHGLGQSHDFGHGHGFGQGHVQKSRTRTRTRPNIRHACLLISASDLYIEQILPSSSRTWVSMSRDFPSNSSARSRIRSKSPSTTLHFLWASSYL